LDGVFFYFVRRFSPFFLVFILLVALWMKNPVPLVPAICVGYFSFVCELGFGAVENCQVFFRQAVFVTFSLLWTRTPPFYIFQF